MAAVVLLAGGCSVSKKTVVKPGEAPGPVLTATKADLIARYNQQAAAVTSLNATVSMKLTAGSAYSGVIEQYREVNGFILASKPASIRVIGQAPVVGKNVFDMVSDGQTFSIFIPSKNKFLVGRTAVQRQAKKPIENLRPQHLVDALLWTPLPSRARPEASVLFEEAEEAGSRYYVLTLIGSRGVGVATGGYGPVIIGEGEFGIDRKIWFDRSNLNMARLENYGFEGKVLSDIRYGDWEDTGEKIYPRQISISRPGDDYKLEITIKKLTLNESISADRFILEQPKGTELVHVGEEPKEQP
jgi:outer membrane lipoprotein-sorting protein